MDRAGGIVMAESVLQIRRVTGVGLFGRGEGAEDVDVMVGRRSTGWHVGILIPA